jgi:hypothetical protein
MEDNGHRKMAIITNLITAYAALVIVIVLHELGHVPKRIKFWFSYYIVPNAAAMNAKYRTRGLLVNIMLFISIYLYKPENVLLQYIGMIAWAHYIFYAIIGSIMPEPKDSQVNLKTYVFDDVPNEKAVLYISSAIIAYILLNDYYVAILKGILI